MADFLIREDDENCPPKTRPQPLTSNATLPPAPPRVSNKAHLPQEQPVRRQPLKARAENALQLQHHTQHQHQQTALQPHSRSNVQLNAVNTCENDKHIQNTKSEKNVLPPVAQFEAFSVYENTSENKENALKPANAQVKQKKKDVPSAILKLHSQRIASPQKNHDALPEASPMSVVSNTSLCSATKAELLSDDKKKATAKTARELFFHVAEYRDDIYKYMREIEKKYRARPDYMRKQTDITHSMRAILVDWLVEVAEEYRLETETLYLAVSYIDRFLSYMAVVRAKLQLVGTTAMFIATKYEEIYPPDLREFVYITDETYTKQQVLRMEHLILKVLSFDLSTPTPLAFISLFCISNGLTERTRYLAMYISELALLEAEPYLQFTSSIIAASAVAISRHTLLCCHCSGRPQPCKILDEPNLSEMCVQAAWTPALKRISGYELSDLKKCMCELSRTHAAAPNQPHQAIVEKYKSNKYDSVALIEAKFMYSMTSPNEKSQPCDINTSGSGCKMTKLDMSDKNSDT